MTAVAMASAPLDLVSIRGQVEECLESFLAAKSRITAGHRLPDEITDTLHGFLFAGGKRLRPFLCVVGWHASGGRGPLYPVLKAAAALEMFHAFTLIHDDIIDRSLTRRGRPTLHRALAARHSGHRDADNVGVSAALLLGDLALTWSDELLHTTGLAPAQLTDALAVVDTMRSEVLYGQYLDLLSAGVPTANTDAALEIIRYKTAKYTCERPLHLGAAIANAGVAVRDALSSYALPLGEAFQLRDDLLGVFGHPELTGKPNLDDLREGKHTLLIALGLQHADADQQHLLRTLVGRPDLDEGDAVRVRAVLQATGARQAVEDIITARYRQALCALDRFPFPDAPTATLRQIARTATARIS